MPWSTKAEVGVGDGVEGTGGDIAVGCQDNSEYEGEEDPQDEQHQEEKMEYDEEYEHVENSKQCTGRRKTPMEPKRLIFINIEKSINRCMLTC